MKKISAFYYLSFFFIAAINPIIAMQPQTYNPWNKNGTIGQFTTIGITVRCCAACGATFSSNSFHTCPPKITQKK